MEYTVAFKGTAFTTVTVEADDPDQAAELAYEQLPTGLCHHCGSNSPMFGEKATIRREWPEYMEATEVSDSNGTILFS